MKKILICFLSLAIILGFVGNAQAFTQRATYQIPTQITTPQEISLDSLQDAFDEFSWQMFVGLNWPVLPNGAPDIEKKIGETDVPGVWQFWKENYDIFLPDGSLPLPWGEQQPPPAICEGQENLSVMRQIGKRPLLLNASMQPFRDGPLIDQNGNYARFQISLNQVMFDYIMHNSLYNREGQQEFKHSGNQVNFPEFQPGENNNPYSGDPGAIMVKTSWKILDKGVGDDPNQFHAQKVLIYTPAGEGVNESCEIGQVGLVGMHIVAKLKNQPQWTWSTFEHIANAPTQGITPPLPSYWFYKKDCDDCLAVNTQPQQPWNPNQPGTPVQVVRQTPIANSTQAINTSWHKALAAINPESVWLNYQLVSTQWPTQPNNPVDPSGNPAPPFLANTTLETYIQGNTPNVSSSCILCHNNATDTTGSFSDFTFTLSLPESIQEVLKPSSKGQTK
ncbi:MAG: hypothetical protein F6J86_22565 [Symploca sp. SIO1B1]|nr:hypothetical protein [Symploca sp. SIO1B1]